MTYKPTIRRGPRWFSMVDRLLDAMATLFQSLAELFLAIMLVINLVNIVLRNLGQSSLLWVAPWTGLLMVWSVFLAFYVMYRRHLDIILMIVIERMGRFGLLLSRILTALCGLALVGIMLAEAPQILSRQRGTMEIIGLTRHWMSAPLLASSLMLAIHFLFDLIAVLCGWTTDEPTSEQEIIQW